MKMSLPHREPRLGPSVPRVASVAAAQRGAAAFDWTRSGASRDVSKVLLVGNGSEPGSDSLVRLLRRGSFDVSLCAVGDVATLLNGGPWDVLIIDAQAAAAAAAGLTRLVRRSFSQTEMPILFIGSQALPATRNEVLAAGANDWMSHPLDPAEVTRRATNLAAVGRLRRAHRTIESAFQRDLAVRTASLDALIEGGLMMSMERDRSRLLRHILDEGQKLLNCDCATMYLVGDDKALRFELRTRDDELPSTRIPMYDATGRPNENYVSVYAALHNRSVVIDDVYGETGFDLNGTRSFDQASGYRTVSMLTVPMAPRGGEVIGVLQFINAMDRQTGQVGPFAVDRVELIEALAAQAAVALDNLNLVESQKQLMESLIRVLATAIDAKSPYTGRHCERVPELAMLLAEAACRTTEGPLADFSFCNEDEWHEFRIGAWLHDCGKVTTPEHVIDKGTKLETIQNRIHEVRMRFEVLLRDLEIERLQALARGEPTATVEADFETRRTQLFDDFAFVAECNIGTEAMEASHIERLNGISKTPWTRHFDDRLGLSQGELESRADEPAVALPVAERLLADRPRDVVPRPKEQQLDPAFDFRIDVPEHLYNHGELYNLSVRRGTLTPEERYKINEHMVHTIMMLERMPFPKNLRRVPEYAGTHHERMDGRGYPRRLGSAELSVPSRIMAVADIFEALTASDRPYKKPKRLSEALSVLQGMAGDHVDPDIFNLFVSTGVFLQYAKKHLSLDQIDVVDGTPYLAVVGG